MPTATPFALAGRLLSGMIRRRLTRTAALLVVASALWAANPGSAEGPAATIDEAATGGAPARNISVPGDVVSVYNFGPLQPAVVDAAIRAAVDAGAWGVVGRGLGIGLVQVLRGGLSSTENADPKPRRPWTK